MLTRVEKEALVVKLKADIERAKGLFVTNVVGITSNDSNSFRKSIRDAKGKVVVTRNTLFRMASAGTYAEKLLAKLKGANAIAFAFDDVAAVAKCIKSARAEEGKEELITMKGGYLGTSEVSPEQFKVLADLPSRDQMLGTLLATFNAPISALARVLNSVREKKEQEAGGAATVTN